MPDQILAALNSSDKSELMNRSVFNSGKALFAFWGSYTIGNGCLAGYSS